MRLIDADELIEIAHRIRLDSRERIERMIESAPTIDAVEVVRCKDCKFYDRGNCTFWDDGYGAIVSSDDYCSQGKKMDEVTECTTHT